MTDSEKNPGSKKTRGRSPDWTLRGVKRTQAQLAAAQLKADAAMAQARDEGWTFRSIAEAADCAHATVRTRLENYDAAQKAAEDA